LFKKQPPSSVTPVGLFAMVPLTQTPLLVEQHAVFALLTAQEAVAPSEGFQPGEPGLHILHAVLLCEAEDWNLPVGHDTHVLVAASTI
jgi:hypothetical protein